MKVIKKGRPQTGWAKEFTCTGRGNGDGGCGAILLVEIGDVFQTTSSCLHEVDYYVTFRCPECKVLTDIPGAPAEVREAAKRQSALWHDPDWKPSGER